MITHSFGEIGISRFWVVGAHVEYVDLRLQAGNEELVHVDVLAVELHAAYLERDAIDIKNVWKCDESKCEHNKNK